MSITQRNTYVIGSNNDLSNALLNIDLNRIGGDLTYLENDAGTLKVSVGSLIEADGSIYAVTGTTFTPTGTAQDGAYLFFDPSVPSFVWSNTAGTYDPARGGIYDGSDRRQCRFRLRSATEFDLIIQPASVVDHVRDRGTDEDTLSLKVIPIGDWNMLSSGSRNVAHGLTEANIRSVSVRIRDDANVQYYDICPMYTSNGVDIQAWVDEVSSGVVQMARAGGGLFDSADYSSPPGGNRGWITIWYVE